MIDDKLFIFLFSILYLIVMNYKKIIKGEAVRCIVRIKPAVNFQREDLRIHNKNIILTDQNNRSRNSIVILI
jgi:hypothetical protein